MTKDIISPLCTAQRERMRDQQRLSPLLKSQQPSFLVVHPILWTLSNLLQLRTGTRKVQLLPLNALVASTDSIPNKDLPPLKYSPTHSTTSPPYLSMVF